MKRLPLVSLVLVVFALIGAGFHQSIAQESTAAPRDRLAELERRVTRMEAEISMERTQRLRVEARLAELERALAPAEPEPPVRPPPVVEPPPTRPEPEPPPVVDPWPRAQRVSVQLRTAGSRVHELALPPPTEWKGDAVSRRSNTWGTLADLHVRAFWDQTHRGDSWVSVQIVNAYEGVGQLGLTSARVAVDGEQLASWSNVLLAPRVALPWATTWPATADAWDWTGDARPFPAWSEAKAQADIADRTGPRNVLLGTWPFWWYDQAADGSRKPRSPGSPAGYGVAPFDGGANDTFTGPWGKAQRWAWTLGESWRGMWFLDRRTGEPELRYGTWIPAAKEGQPPTWDGIDYWTGRESQRKDPNNPQVGSLCLEGYGWDPTTAFELSIDQGTRPEDGPHFRRTWGGAAAIASVCGPAQWVVRMAAYDVMQDWVLDPEEPAHGDVLLGGLSRRIKLANAGYLVPPNANGILGSRYLAQAIFTLCEAKPYMDPEYWLAYAMGFVVFGELITSPDGVCNRDTSGDTLAGTKPPFNLRGPLCSTFHQRLVCGAYRALEELETPGAKQLADRMAAFLGPDPTPYAVEAWQTGAPRDRWQQRKNSVMPSLAQAVRWWSPDGGRYAGFTHNILPAQFASLEAFDQTCRNQGLEENWYATLPRAVWEPLWR